MSINDYIILTAMDKEADNIRNSYNKLVTGIGGCDTIKTLFKEQDKLKDKTIINVGYAGSKQYEIGSIVSVNRVLKYEVSNVVTHPSLDMNPYLFTENACYTADSFIETDNYIPLVDMELYYIRMLFENVVSFKIVSDDLSQSRYNRFNATKAWKEMNEILREFCNGLNN